jgi:hypothetical protein
MFISSLLPTNLPLALL